MRLFSNESKMLCSKITLNIHVCGLFELDRSRMEEFGVNVKTRKIVKKEITRKT